MAKILIVDDHEATVTFMQADTREILQATVACCFAGFIAKRVDLAELCRSVNTARNHMQHVLNKLGAHSKLEATAIARRLGIVRRSCRRSEQ